MRNKDRALLHVIADWTLNRGLSVDKNRLTDVHVSPSGEITPRPSKRQETLILLLTDFWSRVREAHGLDNLDSAAFAESPVGIEFEKFNDEVAALGGGKREAELWIGYVIDSQGYLRRLADMERMYRLMGDATTGTSGDT